MRDALTLTPDCAVQGHGPLKKAKHAVDLNAEGMLADATDKVKANRPRPRDASSALVGC